METDDKVIKVNLLEKWQIFHWMECLFENEYLPWMFVFIGFICKLCQGNIRQALVQLSSIHYSKGLNGRKLPPSRIKICMQHPIRKCNLIVIWMLAVNCTCAKSPIFNCILELVFSCKDRRRTKFQRGRRRRKIEPAIACIWIEICIDINTNFMVEYQLQLQLQWSGMVAWSMSIALFMRISLL